MRLYEMLERVSEVVYQDNPSPLLKYLKNTLDDDGCFLRSRYGRRHEGEVADRELGEVGFIMVASNMPFSPKHVQFKSIETIQVTYKVQIGWFYELEDAIDSISLYWGLFEYISIFEARSR